jgi:L-cysteine S-thiosulfotransferase
MMDPMFRRRAVLSTLLLVTSVGATCDTLAPKDYEKYSSASGLVIGQGDPDQGRANFVALRCHSCHTVDRITFPPLPTSLAERIPLGGKVAELPTDGYLATAIVNPSHDLAEGFPKEVVVEGGRSRMADYGDMITIHQLRDLVAFLHTRYELATPATH